jgi:hypothetical protein
VPSLRLERRMPARRPSDSACGCTPRVPHDGTGHSMTTVPATTDMHYLSDRLDRRDLHVHSAADAGRAEAQRPDRISRWFPHQLNADQVTVRNAGGQHGRLHRLCDRGRSPEAATSRAVPHPHRRGTNQLLGPRRQDEFRARHQLAILAHRQCHPGSGSDSRLRQAPSAWDPGFPKLCLSVGSLRKSARVGRHARRTPQNSTCAHFTKLVRSLRMAHG